MESADGSYCLTFNGEIYNYKEIRQGTRKCGHRFRTGTDTEVILAPIRNGAKNACIGSMACGASRCGIARSKNSSARETGLVSSLSTMRCVGNGRFYFGSEIKQILQASGLPRVANPRYVFSFLEFGLVDFSARNIFRRCPPIARRTLPCSSIFRDPLDPSVGATGNFISSRYRKSAMKMPLKNFASRFENAVRLRLRSDVPVGFSLSGGLDSSAIFCQAKRIAPATHFRGIFRMF